MNLVLQLVLFYVDWPEIKILRYVSKEVRHYISEHSFWNLKLAYRGVTTIVGTAKRYFLIYTLQESTIQYIPGSRNILTPLACRYYKAVRKQRAGCKRSFEKALDEFKFLKDCVDAKVITIASLRIKKKLETNQIKILIYDLICLLTQHKNLKVEFKYYTSSPNGKMYRCLLTSHGTSVCGIYNCNTMYMFNLLHFLTRILHQFNLQQYVVVEFQGSVVRSWNPMMLKALLLEPLVSLTSTDLETYLTSLRQIGWIH